MASYDLRCASCENEFEVFVQGFLRDDRKVCPECGGTEVEQLFTGFLMGSGSASGAGCEQGAAMGCTPSSGFG